jgi:signal transduction histidine kinase
VEALQNATRHAPGSAVRISLAQDRGQVLFTVTDVGPGFDPAATAHGSGLRNMSDRLAALGGSCQVDSRPGEGTTIAGRIRFGDAAAGNGEVPAESGDAVPLPGRMG